MGIIRSGLCFMVGTLYGAYLAQNYNIPDIKKLASSGVFMAKHIEETYRKPDVKNNNGDVDLKD